jgi:tetratricopeptide (TPR) repeat protein
MRNLFFIMLLAGTVAAQTNSSNSSTPPKSQPSNSSSSQSTPKGNPNLAPPRSDRIDAASLGNAVGESSSKDTQIDLSPPPNDAKEHPRSSDILMDEGSAAGGDTTEFHPWDPHKAAKDIEVGDYYFKRKNYVAAESRYHEALVYKDNDADATYKLAVCLEKLERLDEALAQYESYLKILPYGPEAVNAKKAIERLNAPAASAKSGH